MTTTQQRIERAEALLAYALTQPAGFTTYDAVSALGCSEAQFKRSVHDLKRIQADGAATVAWFAPEFRYRVVGNFGETEDPRRFGSSYLDTRIESELAQATTWVNGTPPTDPEYIPALLWKANLSNMRATISVLREAVKR